MNRDGQMIEGLTGYFDGCAAAHRSPDAERVADLLMKYQSPLLSLGLALSLRRCFEQAEADRDAEFWQGVATLCARQVEL